MNLIYSNSTLIKSSRDVYKRKSISTSYSIAISLHAADILGPRKWHSRYYNPDSFGLLYLNMLLGFPMPVTNAKKPRTFPPEIKCHCKIFKRSSSLMYEGLISWAHSLSPSSIYIFLWV
jgi:hypothetical protein